MINIDDVLLYVIAVFVVAFLVFVGVLTVSTVYVQVEGRWMQTMPATVISGQRPAS